ncbi:MULTISPECIES: uracil phosphoribosyltransferase [Turicibacter]|uniref:Uracil phosphoribosyltransferase n=2 Tax=Turicibacter sanguinis TaxID=154288 RepID=A0A173REH8_9FIRM|nr:MULTISPECIES: uracil phosphoribosyltransferase [Turicibacter]EFF63817.1 uracil phosphoribosyltransferase [Turicibacter sanguinis PC909]EGC93447.1 uracil phosphoribosyltransferase [Turicibacter sp. HGF1]MBP3905163.1 uracil phosphoribosyltransferase [Turicibacter sp.]MCU7191510.1 uracil phosphoribosyltransferase [Turicibacter sanguinis]MCU7195422.1 uracil phosphoribosyltransferase [Turicibacter sanguinis]
MIKVNILDHPLIQHKLTQIRQKETSTTQFRQMINEIGGLMVYEITRDLPLEQIEIQTPVATTKANVIAGKKMVVVPILRAGLGMVDGILQMIPSARIGHIGIFRDEETLQPVEYFAKFPDGLDQRDIFIVDPMLATGGSAIAAINSIKKRGAKNIKLVCLVGAPEGVKAVNEAHPDVTIYLASLDEKLNEKGYIVPGLGDAGDRIFGTK